MKRDTDSDDVRGPDTPQRDDMELVSSILKGSGEAWHDFVAHYSGLILGVVKRQLFEADEDRIRTIYVEILASLINGALQTYRAESSLSTWLIVFTRNRARDYLRKLYGRSTEPTGYKRLKEREKLIFRLFYVEMLPLEAIMLQLRCNEPAIEIEDIVRSIRRIESVLNPRYLKNLDERNQARKRGIQSLHLARYLIEVNVRDDVFARYVKPDAEMLEREMNENVRELRIRIAELQEDEQKILYLRFNKELSAREIADEMDIETPRRVYSMIDRVVRKLRKSMERESPSTGKDDNHGITD